MLFVGITASYAQSNTAINVEGTVQSKEDNSPLIGVTIELFTSDDTRASASVTDPNGRFTLNRIMPGTYELVARYIGFEEYRLTIQVPEDVGQLLRIFMDPEVLSIGEIQVQASRFQDSTSTQTSVQRISSTQVQSLAGGQGNVFNLLKVIPSVTSTSDYSSQLIVRGGEANQNLFVLDDIEIYSPYQANGVGSLFNPNIIRDMDFYAGAFPASFGDRLSSVLVINTTTGNPTKALETQLRNKRYSVASTGDLKGARKILARDSFDLVFLDLRLPDGEGTDLLEEIMAKTDG
ncbi:MAG: response regulator, partial [Bacteroidetes bacterium]|nr:response regulator [Bacteroidota bacterium]